MLQPKPISRASLPAALQKAERYRLINDPSSAESICLDVLTVDPQNEQALVTLLLAIPDQFGESLPERARRAREVVSRLPDDYQRAYYGGIVCERCAKAKLRSGAPKSGEMAYQWLAEAMALYEKAESRRPAGHDEAILRWNTCARLLARHPHMRPGSEEPVLLSSE